MDTNTFPTKTNLLNAKKTLVLSRQGFDLMDKKRKILIREIMMLNNKAKQIQADIDKVFGEAYRSLQIACIEMGVVAVERLGYSTPKDESIQIRTRSVMGVEIPIVTCADIKAGSSVYGFGSTTIALDAAVTGFYKVKELIIQLAMTETAAYRLAVSIRKTQKRANALKNVTIPKYEALTKQISETLEERERDEITRMRSAKNNTGYIQADEP